MSDTILEAYRNLIAPQLKQGDKIGFFSPSSPATAFAPKRFERAKLYLESKGFELIPGKLTNHSDHYRSGMAKARADELNELIRNPDVKAIISTIGGYNSNALLPFIDYSALIKNPKIIMGYSDVTALLLAIYEKTGLVTFYGPALVASFGEFPPLVDITFSSFNEIVCLPPQLPYQYKMPIEWTDSFIDWESQTQTKIVKRNKWHFLGKGKHRGRLIGGNLNTLSGIWGSPYMPEIKQGDILLIEDSLLSSPQIERSFNHLKLCGVFDKVKAIILGKHELFDNKGSNKQPFDHLLEVLGDSSLPILYDFDACHTHPMLIMPIGAQIEIDFDTKSISLVSPWLS